MTLPALKLLRGTCFPLFTRKTRVKRYSINLHAHAAREVSRKPLCGPHTQPVTNAG